MAVNWKAAVAVVCVGACAPLEDARVTGEQAIMSNPADLAAIDAVIDSVYAVISGPIGEQRDFDRMRGLFLPDARMTAYGPAGLRGGTVEDYIARSGKLLADLGFEERELARRVEIYGNIAHAWSSYEGNFTTPEGKPDQIRGINSFQLARVDGEWKVQSIFWQQESPEIPLPTDMDGD